MHMRSGQREWRHGLHQFGVNRVRTLQMQKRAAKMKVLSTEMFEQRLHVRSAVPFTRFTVWFAHQSNTTVAVKVSSKLLK